MQGKLWDSLPRLCDPKCPGLASLFLSALLLTPECPHSVGQTSWRMAEISVSLFTEKHLCTHVFLHGFSVFCNPVGSLKPKFKTLG